MWKGTSRANMVGLESNNHHEDSKRPVLNPFIDACV